MDLNYGQTVGHDIMSSPTCDVSDSDPILTALSSNDPQALFEVLGLGGPGQPPIPSLLAPEQVRSKISSLVLAIRHQWTLLNTIIERYEASIQKRWAKKTIQQRKSILLDCWPHMAAFHRPDIMAWRSNKPQSLKDHFMFPYINLEDLTKPRLLPIFLGVRGRHPPPAFAGADLKAIQIGLVAGQLEPGFLYGHVMMFTASTWPNNYGKLFAWSEHPDAFKWFCTQRGVAPRYGLCILEIQERVYTFLVKCCKSILHDISEEDLTNPSRPIEPEPPLLSGNTTSLNTLAVTAMEAPYRLPAELDMERLESFLEAKLLEAEDHIWSLREDPSYFASVALDWKEHRQELLLDTWGRQHPECKPAPSLLLWQRIIRNFVSNAYVMVEIWGCLCDKIAETRRIRAALDDEVAPDKDLPEPYKFALLSFYHHLRQYAKAPIRDLMIGFAASPPVRSCFVREPQDAQSTIMIVTPKSKLPKDNGRDQLIWVFMTLFDEENLQFVSPNTLMDELERLVNSSTAIKELISPWVADQVSDLAVISHCLYQLDLYQPWAASFAADMITEEKALHEEYAASMESLAPYYKMSLSPSTVVLGIPSRQGFHYPIDKRATRENVESMRASESRLDAFWKAMDQDLSGQSSFSPRIERLLSQRILQRTPEWVEPVKKKEQPVSFSGDTKSGQGPLSEFCFHLERTSEQSARCNQPSAPKAKVKTRGIARHEERVPEPDDNTGDEYQEPVFALDKRALKVFNTIFYTPTPSSQPGDVSWPDFLHAMTSLGFTAEKLYGSVWQFNPTKMGAIKRGINFHEPHPSGKIPFHMARRHGRRLYRAYGLHGGSFVLARK